MDYSDIVKWITEQAKKIPYGEISVKIIRHDGRDKLVEKNVSIKEKPEEERSNSGVLKQNENLK